MLSVTNRQLKSSADHTGSQLAGFFQMLNARRHAWLPPLGPRVAVLSPRWRGLPYAPPRLSPENRLSHYRRAGPGGPGGAWRTRRPRGPRRACGSTFARKARRALRCIKTAREHKSRDQSKGQRNPHLCPPANPSSCTIAVPIGPNMGTATNSMRNRLFERAPSYKSVWGPKGSSPSGPFFKENR